MCQPPVWFAAVFPIIQMFALHRGSRPVILESLSKRGLHPQILPPQKWVDTSEWDNREWLDTRRMVDALLLSGGSQAEAEVQ